MAMFTFQRDIKIFKQIPYSKQRSPWWRAISAKTMLAGDVDKMGKILDKKILPVSLFQCNKHVESGRQAGSIV